MRKSFFILFFLGLFPTLFAQTAVNFKWIANFAAGADDSLATLRELLNEAENTHADFVIISGNVAASAKDFAALKTIIDETDIPVKVLPDPRNYADFNNYLSFTENFDEKTFLIKKNNVLLIGLNSYDNFAPAYGRFAPENLLWLSDELEQLPDSLRMVLFTELSPAKIVNFDELEKTAAGNYFETIFLSRKPEEISDEYYFVYPPENSGVADVTITDTEMVTRFENGFEFRQTLKTTVKEMRNVPVKNFNVNKKILSPAWEQSLNSSIFAEATVYKGKIYVAQNDGLLTCFDGDGSVLWDYDLFGDVVHSPQIKDDFVVAATLQGDLILLNALSGDGLQTIGFERPIVSPLLLFDYKWEVNTMSPKKSGSKAAVVFGDAKGTMRCFDVETLEKIWETQIDTLPLPNPVYESGNQILFAVENKVIALDKKNGAILWKRKFPEKISAELALGKSDLFAWTNNALYSVDIKLGEINWTSRKYKPKKVTLSKNRKTLYITDAKGNLIFAESYKGKFKKKFPLKLRAEHYNVFSGNKILIISGDKKVYRINSKGKYATILESRFPLSTAKFYDKKKILFGDVNGNFMLSVIR